MPTFALTGAASEPVRAVEMISGAPEQLFRLDGLVQAPDGSVSGTMRSGPWLAGPEGRGEAAGIALLVDDVLGYCAVQLREGWSVSTEISLDLVAEVPTDGRTVKACARVVSRDDAGALVGGEVVDDHGNLIAVCTLRARFTDQCPDHETRHQGSLLPDELVRDDLEALLHPDVVLHDEGATVRVSPRFANPLGNLHGGMALCLLEWSASRAMPVPGRTASVRVQIVRGAPLGATLSLSVTPMHQGRTLGVVNVVSRDEAGRTCAVATVTRH